MGDKRGFVELRKQKGVCVIPCEEQSSNLFPLVGQEPKQGTQMDRGEVEVEEERHARVRSGPVLRQTEKEHEVLHAKFRSWCEASVWAGRATEDSHKRSETEPSFLGRDTDVELPTILVLIQRPHGAVEACQVLRKSPAPYAIDCVLAYLDTWSLREVLLKANIEPAIQTLVDAVRVRRSERTMVEKSPEYSHQSTGAVESAMRRSRASSELYVCVLQEKLGYKVDNNKHCSTVTCQVRGVRAQSMCEAR